MQDDCRSPPHMTTYVYATIPQSPDEAPRYFEIQQSMQDAPLTAHPETGEAIRRVILGGFGILNRGKQVMRPHSGASCCGPGCGCH